MSAVIHSVTLPQMVYTGELFIIKVDVVFNPLTWDEMDKVSFDHADMLTWQDVDKDSS